MKTVTKQEKLTQIKEFALNLIIALKLKAQLEGLIKMNYSFYIDYYKKENGDTVDPLFSMLKEESKELGINFNKAITIAENYDIIANGCHIADRHLQWSSYGLEKAIKMLQDWVLPTIEEFRDAISQRLLNEALS